MISSRGAWLAVVFSFASSNATVEGAPVDACRLMPKLDDGVVTQPCTSDVTYTTSFASGGFEPVLSLFEGTGAQNLIGQDTFGGTAPGGCGGRGIDGSSGYCLDAFLEQSLNAGTYLLALTESDNFANGPSFFDGFSQQGQGNFTGPEYTGTSGSFLLFDGTQRSSAYLVNLTGDNLSSPTPEPFSAGLIAVGFAAAGLIRRKRKSSSENFS